MRPTHGDRSHAHWGDPLLRWARAALDADVVRDVIEPAIADVRYEAASGTPQARELAVHRGRSILARTLGRALVLSTQRRLRRAPVAILLAPVALMLIGWATLVPIEAHKASHHALFGMLGIGGALACTLAPVRLRRAAPWLAVPTVVGLVLVLLFGETFDGARRWWVVGPLTLHVAALLTPVFAAIALWWRRGFWPRAFQAACAVLLALQPNVAMVVLWGSIATAASGSRERWFVLGGSLLAVAGAARHDALPPASAVDVPLLVGTANPVWFSITVLALAAPIAFALAAARHRAGEARSRLVTLAVALAVWPMLAYFNEGLVLLTYGGSMMVAYLVVVGMVLRDAASPDESSVAG